MAARVIPGLRIPDGVDLDRGAVLLAADTRENQQQEVRAMQDQHRRHRWEASLPARYRAATLDTLDDTQTPDQARAWWDSDSPTLMLVGPPGTGKTHVAYAVLRQAFDAGAWVTGGGVADLLASMRPDAPSEVLGKLARTVDLFLFDDLGAERSTDWTRAQISDIIDARTREGRRQIVTTNLSYAELADDLGPRVMSRLAGGCVPILLAGQDRRTALW